MQHWRAHAARRAGAQALGGIFHWLCQRRRAIIAVILSPLRANGNAAQAAADYDCCSRRFSDILQKKGEKEKRRSTPRGAKSIPRIDTAACFILHHSCFAVPAAGRSGVCVAASAFTAATPTLHLRSAADV